MKHTFNGIEYLIVPDTTKDNTPEMEHLRVIGAFSEGSYWQQVTINPQIRQGVDRWADYVCHKCEKAHKRAIK